MSIKYMTWVWENSTEKGSALLLLLALADAANDDGYCWPGMAYLAKKTRLGRRYVINLIEQLEHDEAISVLHRRNGDKNLSNYYRILAPSLVNPNSLPSELEDTIPSEPENTTLVNPSSPKPLVNRNPDPSPNRYDTAAIQEVLAAWKRYFPQKPQPRQSTYGDKILTRLKDKEFCQKWLAALERASKSKTLQSESWFNFEFFVKNDKNYQKMLDGWMDWKDKIPQTPNGNTKPHISSDEFDQIVSEAINGNYPGNH